MNLMHFLNDPFSIWFWLVWAIFLVWQNYAFTYVSRARNSASPASGSPITSASDSLH